MKNYEELDDFFDYTDKNEWKGYIENQILPLWRNASRLKFFFDDLRQEFHNSKLNDIKENEKKLFLGGITPQNEIKYERDSLAKFYKNYFGLRIEDLKSWIAQESYQEELLDINITIQETKFNEFFIDVFELLDYLIKYQNLVKNINSPDIDYEGLKNNPNQIKDIIIQFLQQILDFSINYNYKTFFLCSINQVHRHYLEKAYPNLQKILNLLRGEFGLNELLWNNPINANSKKFEDYKIFCFPEYNMNNEGKSFGGGICKLNQLIWEYFDDTDFTNILKILLRNVPNLKEEYKDRISNELPENFHRDVHYDNLIVRGSDKTIMEVLDENASFLFTNIKKISGVKEGNIWFNDI
ncbi:MAG: hypothetical protein GF311_24765 [Candidatus Lokiarchaeota archaeon]|nr:hypothetical protein [Candidatus Lokiarchaeota archaeon]